MKIAFYLPEFYKTPHDRAQTVYELAKRLSDSGHTVIVAYNIHSEKKKNITKIFYQYTSQRNFQKEVKKNLNWFNLPADVRQLSVPTPKDKFFPDIDAIFATTPQTAEWIDPFPVEKGVKFHLLLKEDFNGENRCLTVASCRLPLIKIALSEQIKNQLESCGDKVYLLAKNEEDVEWDDSCGKLEALINQYSGEEKKHYLFRRRIKSGAIEIESAMKVLCITSDPSACAQIRMYSPHNFLTGKNFHARYHLISRGRIVSSKYIDWADIVVLQRVRDRRYRRILRRAKKQGKKIIFELDDNLFEIPLDHPFAKSAYKNLRMFPFIRESHAVIVSTEKLKKYIEQNELSENVFVIPNYIDTDIFNTELPSKPPSEMITIGYAGSATHMTDFVPVIPALEKILSKFKSKVKMKFLGFTPNELADLEDVESIEGSESYHFYAATLQRSAIDIGLAPVKKNIFNECKSNIKYLEYSFCGIPGIYASVTPYSSCVRDGENGFMVEPNDTDGWYAAIKKLIENKELRESIRNTAHRDALINYSLQNHTGEWLAVYKKILEK